MPRRPLTLATLAPGRTRPATLEAFSRTEKLIAFCRVLLAVGVLAVVVVDPKEPSLGPGLAYALLGAYVVYSAILFALVRAERIPQQRVGPYSLAADIVWFTAINVFTEGGTSPFFLLYVFVICTASVRWGLRATAQVTLVLALLYPSLALFVSHSLEGREMVMTRAHLFRPIYILVLGYLIGLLGEHQRRSRRKLVLLLDVSAARQFGPPLGRTLTRLMRRALGFLDAGQGILVLRDPDSGRFFTWSITRGRKGRSQLGLRITENDPYPVSFATPAEGFLANDLGPRAATALCYDLISRRTVRRPVPDGELKALRGEAQALIGAPVLLHGELRGRALALRERRRKFTRDDLEFLLLLVAQAAAVLESARLQGKAREVAILEERGRIARDLHDGFIQSLAGIDLRVQACKQLLERDPARVGRELGELQQAVEHGYQEVRSYLHALRTQAAADGDLPAALARLTRELAKRHRMHVDLALPPSLPHLPAAVSYELSQIIREALANAARHGRATRAVVELVPRGNDLCLVVRDNGCGFDGRLADGPNGTVPLPHTPWSIRERVALLGGRLEVSSRPGEGAEVSVRLPAGAAA